MPIRPEMRDKYPPRAEWIAIRGRILRRAHEQCECLGACGLAHDGGRCAVPHGSLIVRGKDEGRVSWHDHSHSGVCVGESCSGILVVLTIAHLDHDPSHNEDANLRALCQLCHLRYDRHEHAKNAAATRVRNYEKRTGQLRLVKGHT